MKVHPRIFFLFNMFALASPECLQKYTGCLQQTYTKLIKRNLKLIALISNMHLFLDCKQCILDLEWLFEHEFQALSFGQLRSFEGIKFVNKLFMKSLHFIRISIKNRNGKVEITSFSEQSARKSRGNFQQTKNELNTAFDNGFFYVESFKKHEVMALLESQRFD